MYGLRNDSDAIVVKVRKGTYTDAYLSSNHRNVFQNALIGSNIVNAQIEAKITISTIEKGLLKI